MSMRPESLKPGLMVLPRNAPKTNELYRAGQYEQHKTDVISTLQPGDVFLDVGANYGYHSLYALRAGAKVYAVEAHPNNAVMCAFNFGINGYQSPQDYEIFQVAASNVNDQVMLYCQEKPGQHSLINPSRAIESVCQVTAMRLDDLITGKVTMIKIDVEGVELRVLSGMTRLLRDNPKATLLIEAHTAYGVTKDMVMSRLKSHKGKIVF